MTTLCIVSGGMRKIWDKRPDAGAQVARDAYIGPFSRKCQEYASMFYPSSWCFLAAKYGFCLPGDIIPGRYDVIFCDNKMNPIIVERLKRQARERHLNAHRAVVVLGGVDYLQIAKQVFPDSEVLNPLAGCEGIGIMIKRSGGAVRTRKPCPNVLAPNKSN